MEATGNITIFELISRFKKVDISLIENENIDCTTLGVYTKLIVLGKKWNLNVKGLRKHLGLSDEKVRKALSMLEQEGYIVRTPYRNEKGQLVGWNYTIYPTPVNEDDRSQAGLSKDNPQLQIPTTPISDNSDNGELINNRLNQHIDLNNNKEEIDKSISKKDDLFEKCWQAYRRKGSKAKAKPYWKKLTEEEKQRVLPHIKVYVTVRDISYQKDFERYLRDKIFDTVIVNGKDIVYDPTCGTEAEYHPYGNLSINFSDKYQCYISIADFNGTVVDGYEDDERPDGATIMLNSGRGTIVWSKAERRWIHKK